MRNYYIWQIMFSLVFIGILIAIYMGVPSMILANESYLTFFNILFFLMGTIYTGFSIKKQCKNILLTKTEKNVLKYFVTGCTMLGLIASVIGFIMVFDAIKGIEVTFSSLVQAGVSASLWGTLSGLIGAYILRTQQLLVR